MLSEPKSHLSRQSWNNAGRKLYWFLFFLVLPVFSFLNTTFIFGQVQTGSFQFEGRMRDYFVFLPQNYNGVTKMPVVFNLHGWTLDMMQQMNYTRMNAVADTAGFIVVYPNAVNATWSSGIADFAGINDVGFFNVLIDTLAAHYSINLERIYSCGFSNGGFMSFRLACELSNRIAAVASVSGTIAQAVANSCNANHSMPVLHVHGTADLWVPYNGAYDFCTVEQTLNHWIDFNICTVSDTTLLPDLNTSDGCTVERINYSDCSDTVSVVFYKVINGGHSWPGGDKQFLTLSNIGKTNGDFNASAEIWNFFKNYKLSGSTKVTDYCQNPIEFSLCQNYPNPFNPSTNIGFRIASASGGGLVTLKVYDVLGNEIATLINEEKPAGTYEVTLNTDGLASGVYFYQLKADNFINTKKMILLR